MFRQKSESLAERFLYEGRIGHFDQFLVFGAVYFDESGDDPRHKRIGIASCLTDAGHWLSFESEWRKVLSACGREHSFHANRQDDTQRALNVILAMLMRQHRIVSFCVTVDTDEYRAATTPVQRGWYGNEYGFARYVSLILTSHALSDLNRGDFGYYVDQGGKGVDWIMQTMATIYRLDQQRKNYRMAAFGLVDRRRHLPVHAADLVAHEVITNRENSLPLSILGESYDVEDSTREQIVGVMASFTELQRWQRHQKTQRKAARKTRKNGG